MTRVDFYILQAGGGDTRLRTACRIAEKSYGKRLPTHIHTDSEDDARRIDALLWTFRDRSFIPHKIGLCEGDELEVTISYNEVYNEAGAHNEENNAAYSGDDNQTSNDAHNQAHPEVPEPCNVLINLATDVPIFFSRFERVAEIIDQDTATRDSGRQRYRFYRDRGYPLTNHQL